MSLGKVVGYSTLGEGLIGVDARSVRMTSGWEHAGQVGIGAAQTTVSAVAITSTVSKINTASSSSGLTTPNEFFSNKTVTQANKALEKKYGMPRYSESYKNAYYNQNTRRSFTVHNEVGHGPAHVDLTRKGFSNYRQSIPLNQ